MMLTPFTTGAVICLTLLAVPAAAQSLPIVDAHSQFDEQVAPSTIIAIMDRAGVSRIILSARGRVQPASVAELARSNPDRIIAAIRTKGGDYDRGGPAYYRMLQQQVGMPGFQALAEVLLWHAKKGKRAPEVDVALADPQAQAALKVALDRKLPFIAHYEFRALAAQRGEAEKRKRLAEHWGDFYVEQVALWRKALGEFPVEIARSVAHRNAERLWRLPPAAC